MEILKTINKFFRGFKAKSVDFPTVTGGFDIFNGLSWANSWNKTKLLKTYSKSLYVFACVSKIAKKTASIDWNLYEIKNKSGDKEEVFVHEALDVLYRPNPFQTKSEFYERFMINKLLAGEAFILKVRNERGEVKELWNLRPDYMRILIDKNDPRLVKGYEFTRSDGKTVFAPEDIIHDAYPSPLDEFGGISALQSAQARVDTEEFASKYQSNFFKNNARPDFIFTTEGKISADQKEEIKEKFEKRHMGPENSGKGAFLQGGMKYQQVSISQREMDYIESMRFTRDDILVAFQVPKPIVAITDDVNLANAKTAMDIFLTETIKPEISRLTEKLNEHFIYPDFGDNLFIHYDESFIPRNEKEKAEIDKIQLESGTKLINEVREENGDEPIVGGWSLYKPLNMVAVGGLPQTKSSKKIGEDKRRVFKGRSNAYKFLDVRDQVKKELYKGILKELKKKEDEVKITKYIKEEIRGAYFETVNKAIDQKGESFKPAILKFANEQKERVLKELDKRKDITIKAVDGLFDKKKEDKILSEISFRFIEEFIRQAGEEAIDLVNPAEEFDLTADTEKFVKERSKELAKEVNSTTVDKLARTIGEGIGAGEGIVELRERVNNVYSEYDTYRAEMIARTEATGANNLGFIEGYKQSGVANAKEWIATADGNTRDSHNSIDGDVVGLDEKFANGLSYPGDPSGGAEEVINCRCVIAPVFRE